MKKVFLLLIVTTILFALVACEGEIPKTEKICWSCGESITKQAIFCEHCGVQQEGGETQGTEATSNDGIAGSTQTPTDEPTTTTCSHNWKDATCTAPKTCSVCGATEGEPIEHTWMDATCTAAKTCSVCGATEGNSLGHDYGQYAIEEATCTSDGTKYLKCITCGDERQETINAFGHEWIDATYNHPQYCENCGLEVGEALFDTDSIENIIAAHCYKNVLNQAKIPSSVSIERAYYTASNGAGYPMVILECSAANSLGGLGVIYGTAIYFTADEYYEKYGNQGASYTDVNYYFNSSCYICCDTYNSRPYNSYDGFVELDIEGILATYDTISFG